jgi:hypothetical protein
LPSAASCEPRRQATAEQPVFLALFGTWERYESVSVGTLQAALQPSLHHQTSRKGWGNPEQHAAGTGWAEGCAASLGSDLLQSVHRSVEQNVSR